MFILNQAKMKFPVVVICLFHPFCAGMLKPKESESRYIQEMNGMWNFRADKSPTRNQGMMEKWWEEPLSEVWGRVWFCCGYLARFQKLYVNIVGCNLNVLFKICTDAIHPLGYCSDENLERHNIQGYSNILLVSQ